MSLVKKDLQRMFSLYGIEKQVTLKDIALYSFHPRFSCVAVYRLAKFLAGKRIPLFPKFLLVFNTIVFNIEIALDCEIAGGLFIPHSFGIVIGAGKIGENATIYQNVTLGAKNLDIPFNTENRPCLGSNVTISSGAVVLGAINIGDNVIVAANSVVLNDVEPNTLVAGAPAIVKKRIV